MPQTQTLVLLSSLLLAALLPRDAEATSALLRLATPALFRAGCVAYCLDRALAYARVEGSSWYVDAARAAVGAFAGSTAAAMVTAHVPFVLGNDLPIPVFFAVFWVVHAPPRKACPPLAWLSDAVNKAYRDSDVVKALLVVGAEAFRAVIMASWTAKAEFATNKAVVFGPLVIGTFAGCMGAFVLAGNLDTLHAPLFKRCFAGALILTACRLSGNDALVKDRQALLAAFLIATRVPHVEHALVAVGHSIGVVVGTTTSSSTGGSSRSAPTTPKGSKSRSPSTTPRRRGKKEV